MHLGDRECLWLWHLSWENGIGPFRALGGVWRELFAEAGLHMFGVLRLYKDLRFVTTNARRTSAQVLPDPWPCLTSTGVPANGSWLRNYHLMRGL